ncbi:MAG: hypothetical protein NT135_01920 [Candidatus Berkelbacteria bacterium]|nr:hypothetical protein [Candidatus Berkelbacteria bacterium]
MEFTPKNLQTALFVKDSIKELITPGYDKYSLIDEIKKKISDIFDAEPVVLPFPPDTPQNIPRIILKNKNETYSCNISINRVDIFQSLFPIHVKNLDNALKDQKTTVIKIFNFFKNKDLTINRIGFVVSGMLKINDNSSAEYLTKEFIKTGKLDIPRELSIVYNKRLKIKDNDYNHRIVMRGGLDKQLFLQIDINTIPEMMAIKDLKIEDIKEILDYSTERITKINEEFPNFKIKQ